MTNKMNEKDVAFVQEYLFYEMVDNRCFCEPGSREFVEFRQATITSQIPHITNAKSEVTTCAVEVEVQFSGETKKFKVLTKILPIELYCGVDFNGFLNEEIIHNKGTIHYGQKFFPKCYEADMGRNGRPVIVVDDPDAHGYKRVYARLYNERESQLLIEKVARFHGKGLTIKQTKFETFREMYANIQDVILDDAMRCDIETRINVFLTRLKALPGQSSYNVLIKYLGTSPYDTLRAAIQAINELSTLCHGHLSYKNIWIKEQNTVATDIILLNWDNVRYGSLGLDLVFLLLQCELPPQDLLKIYTKSFQMEYPTIDENQIKQQIQFGLLYVLVTLAPDDMRFEEFVKNFDDLCKIFLQ